MATELIVDNGSKAVSQAAQTAIKSTPSPLDVAKLEALKNDFLSTISHELRTPLSNIYLAVQLLEILLKRLGGTAMPGQAPDADLTQIFNCLRTVQEECKREINLVDDLLLLQQLELGPPALMPVCLSLQDWLMDLMPTLQAIAIHHQQHLQIELPKQTVHIVIDLAFARRVIVELVTNACKFTPSGETISFFVRTPPHQLEIVIQNPGDPIPPEDMPHIFDKFRRVPGPDPWKRGGIGIGLTLAQRLAQHLGGGVLLEQVEGHNQFTVTFSRPPSQE